MTTDNTPLNNSEKKLTEPTKQTVLIYDGDCSFCQSWVNWAMRHRADKFIAFHAWQQSPELLEMLGLPESAYSHYAVYAEIANNHVVRLEKAAGAVNAIMAKFPGIQNVFYRVAARLYTLAVIKQLEDFVYGFVAKNRHRLHSGPNTCKLPPG